MKIILLIFSCIVLIGCSKLNNKNSKSLCVPNQKKAIFIADSVWVKEYGERVRKKNHLKQN